MEIKWIIIIIKVFIFSSAIFKDKKSRYFDHVIVVLVDIFVVMTLMWAIN